MWTRRAHPSTTCSCPGCPPRQAAGHLTGGTWRRREQPVGVTLLQASGRLGPESQAPRGTCGPPLHPPPRSLPPTPADPAGEPLLPPSPGASITGLGRCGAPWRPLPSRSAHSWPRALLGNSGVPSTLSACARGQGEEEDGADVQAAGWGSAGPKATGLAGPGRGVSRPQPGPRQKGRPLFSEAVAPSHCHPGLDEATESGHSPLPAGPVQERVNLQGGKGPRSKDANLRGLRRSQLGGASGHTAINHTVSDSSWDQAQVTAPGRVGVDLRGGPVQSTDSARATDSPVLKPGLCGARGRNQEGSGGPGSHPPEAHFL